MPLTILTLHGVGPLTRGIDAAERECWLDVETMDYVLDQAKDKPHVRLTVDDGNVSDFNYVLPALVRRNLKAAFFLCSERIDQPSFLTKTQVRELRASGMQIGSHGAAHQSWRGLSVNQLDNEIIGSRRTLESICGASIDSAACPFGAYDRRVLRSLGQAGYQSVYTSDRGSTSDRHWLRARNSITRSMSQGAIIRLLNEGVGVLTQLSIDIRRTLKRLRT